MQTWADGYITELPYTRNFFPDLSPVHLNLVCSLAGVAPPRLNQGFDYCELGCGQGLSTTLLAAVFPQGRFWGVDFNPAHISLAQKFAREAGLENLTFLDASFEEVLDREDLPGFDYITLHGIYSWVSHDQQQNIINLIHGCLKPGGVVYNSYNAKPGKTDLEPVRRVFKELIPRAENPALQVKQGFGLLEKLIENPRGIFLKGGLDKRIQGLKQHPHQYVVHEFLNEHWKSFYCTDVFKDMAKAKLTYVGSASLGLNFDALSVPKPFLEEYKAMATLEQRQLFRDLLLNTAFRKDVYVRGPIPLSVGEHRRVNGDILLGRSAFHKGFQGVYPCGAGQVDMTKNKNIPLIYERLSRESLSLAELVHGMPGMDPSQVMDGVRHLLTSSQISAMAVKDPGNKGISRVNQWVNHRINQLSLDRVADQLQGAWLCSRELGNAVLLPFIQALMLKAHLETESKEMVPGIVAKALAVGGATFQVNDQQITDPEDMLGHVKGLYAGFSDTLTELERLGIL